MSKKKRVILPKDTVAIKKSSSGFFGGFVHNKKTEYVWKTLILVFALCGVMKGPAVQAEVRTTNVTANLENTYTVTIPEEITIENQKEANYEIKVKGDIAGTKKLYAVPSSTITMSSDGKEDTQVYISQDETKWKYNDITTERTTTGTLNASLLSAGRWTGVLTFDVGIESCNAGLYDANDNLLVSWDDLVNVYGLDIEKDYTIENFQNNKAEGSGVEVFNTNSLSGKLILPDTITHIGSFQFFNSTALTGLELSDGVTSIGENAFYCCKALTSVNLGENLKDIGCRSFCLTSITNIDFPDSLLNIEDYAFSSSKLKSVIIPGSIETISEYAFADSDLKSITIEEGITAIGDSAFAGTRFCETISIPQSVTSIGKTSFYEMGLYSKYNEDSDFNTTPPTFDNMGLNVNNFNNHSSLNEKDNFYWGVSLKDSNYNILSCNGAIVGIDKELTNLVIPTYIKAIKNIEAYSNLKTVVFEKGNTNDFIIENYAFNNSEKLESITYNDANIVEIGKSAFQYCYSLKKIEIPDTVVKIGNYAYNHCSSAENITITIPASVKQIGLISDDGTNYATHCFYNCGQDDLFTSFEVESGNTAYKAVDGVLYSYDGTTMVSIPKGKTFENNTFVMPDTVTHLGELSFSKNKNIDTVTLSDNFIINETEKNDVNQYLNEGNSLSIAIYAYTNVSRYEAKETNNNYSSYNGCIYSKDGTALLAVPAEYKGALNIKEGCISINKNTFYINYNDGDGQMVGKYITNVNIPSSITNIEADQIAYLNECVKRGMFTVFVDESNSVYALNSEGQIVTSVSVGENASDWEYTLDTSAKTITLKNLITEGTRLIIPATFTIDNVEYSTILNKECARDNTALTTIIIKEGITAIPNSAFCNDTNVVSVSLPSTLTFIEGWAFQCMTNVAEIDLSNCKSLITISSHSFNGCTNATITVPSPVINIYDNAFENVKLVYYSGGASGSPWGANKLIKLESIIGTDINDWNYTLDDTRKTITLENLTGIGTTLDVPASFVIEGTTYTTIMGNECARNFNGGTQLTKIIIEEGISNIPGTAFCEDANVTYLSLPSTIKTIDGWACLGMTQLESLEITGDTLTTIRESAFDGCASLTIKIPSSVQTIDTKAFSNVKKVIYSGSASGSPWEAIEVTTE